MSVDATIIRPYQEITVDTRVGDGKEPVGVRDLLAEDLGDYVRVYKQGWVTGITEGFLEPILAEERVQSGTIYRNGWWVEAEKGAFAGAGDSGSIVTDQEGYVVGMVVANNTPSPDEPRLTYCHAIAPILDELDVVLPA
jgi:hypothetical protein